MRSIQPLCNIWTRISRTDVPVRIRNGVVQIDIQPAVRVIVRVTAESNRKSLAQKRESSPLFVHFIHKFTLPYKWFTRKSRTDDPGRKRNGVGQSDTQPAARAIARATAEERQTHTALILVKIIAIERRRTSDHR